MAKNKQEHDYKKVLDTILFEVQQTLSQVATTEVNALVEAVLAAPQVFVTGEGRSGLVARSFAMRLTHLGRNSYVTGETVTPAAKPGDLLLAITGSGATRVTAARIDAAQAVGVTVAVITSARKVAREGAAVIVTIPAPSSRQFGGTRFEQAALLLLDAVILLLQLRLGQSEEEMVARHATLE